MISAPLIQGPKQVLGWATFSLAVLAVPVAALLGQLSPPLPHLARLPNLPLQTVEGRLIDSHAFLGEVLIVELAPEPCGPAAPGCAARGAALAQLAVGLDDDAPVRLLSLLPVEGGAVRGQPDPSRWNLLRVPAPGIPALQERVLAGVPMPDDALLLFDAQGSLRAVFSAAEVETLQTEAERLARGLPARAALSAPTLPGVQP